MTWATDPATGTSWPIDKPPTSDDVSLAWKLRYGQPDRVDLLHAAAIVSTYTLLANGANARESLARLRRAAKSASTPPTTGGEP